MKTLRKTKAIEPKICAYIQHRTVVKNVLFRKHSNSTTNLYMCTTMQNSFAHSLGSFYCTTTFQFTFHSNNYWCPICRLQISIHTLVCIIHNHNVCYTRVGQYHNIILWIHYIKCHDNQYRKVFQYQNIVIMIIIISTIKINLII